MVKYKTSKESNKIYYGKVSLEYWDGEYCTISFNKIETDNQGVIILSENSDNCFWDIERWFEIWIESSNTPIYVWITRVKVNKKMELNHPVIGSKNNKRQSIGYSIIQKTTVVMDENLVWKLYDDIPLLKENGMLKMQFIVEMRDTSFRRELYNNSLALQNNTTLDEFMNFGFKVVPVKDADAKKYKLFGHVRNE